MKRTAEYLRKIEWSMGSGQCPECQGVNSAWVGHPLYPDEEMIGHVRGCGLAAAIDDLGLVDYAGPPPKKTTCKNCLHGNGGHVCSNYKVQYLNPDGVWMGVWCCLWEVEG